ncbi:MAG: PAS domain S-box protein, partial [Desulfovibrionaceae bacterium]
ALRESEARLRSIFENAPVGIFQARPGGRFLSVNPEFARIAGFNTSEELLQQAPNIGEFFESPGLMDELRRLLDEQGEIVDYEVPAQRRDGSPVWVSANAVVLYDAADQASRFEGFVMDITARRLAQEALAESEGRYRALFERSSSGILLLREGTIINCNPKAEVLFGRSREALLGRRPEELSPETQPGGRPSAEIARTWIQNMEQGEPAHFEWQHRRGETELFWADISLTPIVILGELHTLAEVNDITERKRAEEQSRMFARIASASNDHMAFLSPELVYLAVNDAYAGAMNLTRERMVGRWAPELLGEESWSLIRPHVEACLRGKSVNYSAWFTFPGLGRRYFEASYYPFYGPAGTVAGFVVNRRDITDRKYMQDALVESERKYRLLAENSADVIWILDRDLHLTYVSPAVLQFIGYPAEEVLRAPEKTMFAGEFWQTLNTLPDELRALVGKKEVGDWPRRFEVCFRHRAGGEVWADVALTAIRGVEDRVEGFQGVARDVTERKQSREALARNLRFERVLNLCARRLLSAADSPDLLDSVLREVLDAAGVSRVFVFENYATSKGALCARRVHELCAPGVDSVRADPLLHRPCYDKLAPRWKRELSAGRGIHGVVAELPQAERELLEGLGVRSMAVTPVQVGGAWYGFMGWADVAAPRRWLDSELVFMATVADIVGAHIERSRAEARLREAYVELDQIFNSTGNGMALLDLDGRIVRSSVPLQKMFGWDGPVVGHYCRDVVPADPCAADYPQEIIQSGEQYEGHEFFVEDAEGERRWFSSQATPFYGADGRLSGVVVTYREITRRIRAQEDARRHQEQLVQAD